MLPQFTPLFNETPIANMGSRGRSVNVWDGLVGGHLPVLVFSYPDSDRSFGPESKYWEMA